MDKTKKAVRKREAHSPKEVERAKSGKTFAPDVDILEDDKVITLVAEMPGVDEKSIDITLAENVLDIRGRVEQERPDGYRLVYTEYEGGDYHRSFSITEEVEKDGIEATVKDGVLRLTLPKTTPVTKKIAVRRAS